MVFELVDLESLGQSALREFNDSVVSAPPGNQPAVEQAASRLMAKVEFAYGVAAKLAHREPTLEGTEAIWAKLVAICDEIARQMQSLGGPGLAGSSSPDRLLDYRNAAERRRQLHA
jgi:hypothetical protein